MNTVSQTVSIIDIIPETSDTQTFHLGTYFPYKAGQSLSLLIPGDPKKRFYSISSSPTERGSMAITIKADRQQPLLYDSLFSLNKGAQVEIAGPFGNMYLPETLEGPYYFLAAGSGVTPFRAMTKFIIDTRPSTETWLFHSVKTPDDLFFREQFLEWAKNPAFHYVPTFTHWNDADETVTTGRIGESLLRKHLPLMEGMFFLCGPKEFVKDMEHVLGSLHIPAKRTRREQW
jgi:ferredoxin-NADP reductase